MNRIEPERCEPAGAGCRLCERPTPTPGPVRVCFLIDRLDTAGTETQLLALIRNLNLSRVIPYLVLLDGEDENSRALEPTGSKVMRLGVRKQRSFESLKKLLEFRRFLLREHIDVLQAYFPDSTYFGTIAARLAGVEAIVRTRNNINHWMTPLHRRLGRLLNRFVTVTVCNSQAAREAVLADERPDPASVVVIENGVDLERFAHIPPVSPVPDPRRKRCVGMVANLRPVKGVDVLIRAASVVALSFPDVEFRVAGEGPARPELEQLIAELGLEDRFLLEGKVADIPSFLAALDIAVLSSRAEGMPNAVLEYMAAGRPIVVTGVGGTPGLVHDRIHARIVIPEDPRILADCLLDLLNDPQEASRLGQAARLRARERYSRLTCVGRFERLYQNLLHCDGER
jgi:glycosyltransferase involved in cell wall biosynthesis